MRPGFFVCAVWATGLALVGGSVTIHIVWERSSRDAEATHRAPKLDQPGLRRADAVFLPFRSGPLEVPQGWISCTTEENRISGIAGRYKGRFTREKAADGISRCTEEFTLYLQEHGEWLCVQLTGGG
jgi:hypothetical protein